MPRDPALLIRSPSDQTQEGGHQSAELLLARGLPCEAVIADSDMRAVGLIERLRQAGVRVPDDISVMGYDGLDNATLQPPFLTTLRLPFERMIRAAIEAVEKSGRVRSPVRHLSFVGEIWPGQTVRPKGSA